MVPPSLNQMGCIEGEYMKPEKRLARIQVLMSRLEAGKDVSLGSLGRVISPEQMAKFTEGWKEERASRKEPAPKEIRKYQSLLQRGLLTYGQYEANHHKLSTYESTKLAHKADSEFEKALEFACEMVQIKQSLRLWLDRDPETSESGAPAGIPRVVTSKSSDNQATDRKLPFTNTKRDLKLVALSAALDELQGEGLKHFTEPKSVLRDSSRVSSKTDFSDWKF